MKRIVLPALLPVVVACGVFATLAAVAKPVAYKIPEETATLKPGAGVELVQGNCLPCHSVDYIQTQPRGPKFKQDFWKAEVVKMIKVFGAPIEEKDIDGIANYLSTNY